MRYLKTYLALSTLFVAGEASISSVLRHALKTAQLESRDPSATFPLAPKVFIISLFANEGAVWPGPYELTLNVSSPGFSPLYPQAFCQQNGTICQLTFGESEINAAATAMALVLSPVFDLTKTYFLIAGIAGVNPACGTIGGVSLAQYAVQVGLEYEVIPTNLSSPYIPFGAKSPDSYPSIIYGTEAFELSVSLRDRALELAQKAKLADSPTAIKYRKKYPHAPANKPPSVFAGDVETSDVYWHGAVLGNYFDEYFSLLTNGSGKYCMTAQEDNAIMESFVRGAVSKRVDFSRIISMRTGSNFDRAPPGGSALHQLLDVDQGGFEPAIENLYNAGHLIVDDIVANWQSIYKKGITVTNYIGDLFGTLKGKFPPDIGSPSSIQG